MGGYKSIINPAKDKLNDNLGDHVPEAENNNRTVKERVRATFHMLPSKAISQIMEHNLIIDCTSKLNMFPAKGSISQCYNPRIILDSKL